MKRLALGVALAILSPVAAANCPPMATYSVAGVTANGITMPEAVNMLLAGTSWKAEVLGTASNVNMSYRSVSGPLDQVFGKVIEQAGLAANVPISAVSDPTRCIVTISVVATAASVAHAQQAAASSQILKAGENLSTALEKYVAQRGWRMRWNIDEDYALDVDLPLPAGDVIEAVTWVVRTYQSQGGMEGVVPRFAKGNNVVVLETMNVRENP